MEADKLMKEEREYVENLRLGFPKSDILAILDRLAPKPKAPKTIGQRIADYFGIAHGLAKEIDHELRMAYRQGAQDERVACARLADSSGMTNAIMCRELPEPPGPAI